MCHHVLDQLPRSAAGLVDVSSQSTVFFQHHWKKQRQCIGSLPQSTLVQATEKNAYSRHCQMLLRTTGKLTAKRKDASRNDNTQTSTFQLTAVQLRTLHYYVLQERRCTLTPGIGWDVSNDDTKARFNPRRDSCLNPGWGFSRTHRSCTRCFSRLHARLQGRKEVTSSAASPTNIREGAATETASNADKPSSFKRDMSKSMSLWD